MKKQLLLAAAALLGMSASAQTMTRYVAGTPLNAISDLQSGYYMISGLSGGQEALVYSKNDAKKAGFWSSTKTLEYTEDANYIWYIDVTPGEGEANATFTVKNVADNQYLSVKGNSGKEVDGEIAYTAKGNIFRTDADNGYTTAVFELTAPGCGDITYDFVQNGTRFNWHLTNAQFKKGTDI